MPGGGVVTWGDPDLGGDSSAVAEPLDPDFGGDSSAVAEQLEGLIYILDSRPGGSC